MEKYVEILRNLRKVPKGKVTTYKHLAKICGLHPRAVAQILKSNKEPEKYPCYKVVMSDGGVGGYNKGVKKKIELLRRDGIEVTGGKINLERFGWEE